MGAKRERGYGWPGPSQPVADGPRSPSTSYQGAAMGWRCSRCGLGSEMPDKAERATSRRMLAIKLGMARNGRRSKGEKPRETEDWEGPGEVGS